MRDVVVRLSRVLSPGDDEWRLWVEHEHKVVLDLALDNDAIADLLSTRGGFATVRYWPENLNRGKRYPDEEVR